MDKRENVMISVRSMSDEARFLLRSCGTNGQIAYERVDGCSDNSTRRAIDELVKCGLVNEDNGKFYLTSKGEEYMRVDLELYREEHFLNKDDYVRV